MDVQFIPESSVMDQPLLPDETEVDLSQSLSSQPTDKRFFLNS